MEGPESNWLGSVRVWVGGWVGVSLPGGDNENIDELWGAELLGRSEVGDEAISLFQNGIELVEYDICLGSQAFHISM